MKNIVNKDKLITIITLPLMWLLYFSFEIITGRVNDFYTLFMNLLLTIVFGVTGLVIYNLSNNYPNGLNKKIMLITFSVLMIIDQGSKLLIKIFFFNDFVEIIPNFLFFDPIINTYGSWLNARFEVGIGFTTLITFNAVALILFIEIYRYYSSKDNKFFWSDMAFLFIMAGGLGSLIDKLFYGGSLDFIGISNLFIADIKDIYINLGILFFIMLIYVNGYFSDDDSSTLKDDFTSLKKFLDFVKSDITKKRKR